MAANPFGAHQAGIGIAGRNKGAIFWLHPYDRARHQWLWIAGAIWWRAFQVNVILVQLHSGTETQPAESTQLFSG